jgi:hypothetical protein
MQVEKHNVDVIPFKACRVWFFLDEHGQNVIAQYFGTQDLSDGDRMAFEVLVDICEGSGRESLAYCTMDLGDGFHAVKVTNSGRDLALIYCEGPFSPTEITFLTGAAYERKRLKPHYVKGIAEENLEALRASPSRRRRWNQR